MRKLRLIATLGWLMLLGVPFAHAQGLADPTRPPAGFNMNDSDRSVAGPVLQSVKISAAERAAIINGQLVKLGDRYGDARVVRIAENEVVLRSAHGTETLKMYPAVETRVNSGAPATPAPAPPRGKATKPRATTPRGQQ